MKSGTSGTEELKFPATLQLETHWHGPAVLTSAPPTLSPRSVCTSTTLLRPVRKFLAHSSFLLCYSAYLGGTRGAGSPGGGEECFILPSLTLKGWLLWFPSLGGFVSATLLLQCPPQHSLPGS